MNEQPEPRHIADDEALPGLQQFAENVWGHVELSGSSLLAKTGDRLNSTVHDGALIFGDIFSQLNQISEAKADV
jgi:hypothetical protein